MVPLYELYIIHKIMFFLENPTLAAFIESSEVLRTKLSASQREKFLETALSLPSAKQKELLDLLKKEHQEIELLKQQYGENYEKQVKKFISTEKKHIESTMRKKEIDHSETLLKNL